MPNKATPFTAEVKDGLFCCGQDSRLLVMIVDASVSENETSYDLGSTQGTKAKVRVGYTYSICALHSQGPYLLGKQVGCTNKKRRMFIPSIML